MSETISLSERESVFIKRFLLISVAIHAVVFAALYFLPEPQTKKARDFITQLVTPEQAAVPQLVPPPPPPVVTPQARQLPPKPVPVRPAPPAAMPPRRPPASEPPLVPGQGKEGSRPLPDGFSPRPGGREAAGEGGRDDYSPRPGYSSASKKPGSAKALSRDELFDRDVIGSTAVKGDGGKVKSDALTFDTEDYRYAGYMRRLKEKIESIWEYPPDAGRKGIYGDLKISFTIKKNGKLGAVELVRTSGHKLLDDAALQAVRDGEPYWPIPDDWGMDSYTIQGHFFYTIYGYGIR